MSARHTRKRGKKATSLNTTKRLCVQSTLILTTIVTSASGSSHVEDNSRTILQNHLHMKKVRR